MIVLPRLVTIAEVQPWMACNRKGMSDPNVCARSESVSKGMFRLNNLLSATNIAAALEEPPARPAPVGICFVSDQLMESFLPM